MTYSYPISGAIKKKRLNCYTGKVKPIYRGPEWDEPSVATLPSAHPIPKNMLYH
uniref:Uncharacterized protein n=1 Tax=uncultured Desulfobacterium sp. TaxID=201089 RepID=E1YCN3_9BACT|nr:unknown protein [uncultured Desulfobacterium sp.]